MTTPKDEILQELLKGCGEIESIGRSPCSKENGYCDDCWMKIEQHKISTNAERKRILEIIDKWWKKCPPSYGGQGKIRAHWEDIVELKQQITQEGEKDDTD